MVKSSEASKMSHLTATLPTNGNGGLVSLNGGLNNNALHESNLNSLKGDVNMNLNDKEMIEEEEEQPEVDINISNVVCHFNTKCHLNLRKVAMNGANVEYKREQGVVSMKIRHPKVTASIWSSGKITVTGSTSEDEAKVAARKVARILQKMDFKVKFTEFRVVNVLGSVILPFGIRIAPFTEENRRICSYEPEIHPGATYRFGEASATLKIFQTGAITITAPSVSAVQSAVEHIYPLVFVFKKDKPPQHVPARKRILTDNNENMLKGAHKSKKRRKYDDHSDEDDFINDEELIDEEMSTEEDF